MSLRLKLLERHLPESVKVRMLDRLASVTAEGFGVAKVAWLGRGFEARLEEYAEFTALHAAQCVSSGDGEHVEAIRARLRSGATRLGAQMRALLGVRGRDDAFKALRLLYRGIGIDLHSTPSGTVTVRGCYFSRYYNPGICCVVEALDQGLADGLFAGASLRFSQRITEGLPSCQARLRLWMAPPVSTASASATASAAAPTPAAQTSASAAAAAPVTLTVKTTAASADAPAGAVEEERAA